MHMIAQKQYPAARLQRREASDMMKMYVLKRWWESSIKVFPVFGRFDWRVGRWNLSRPFVVSS